VGDISGEPSGASATLVLGSAEFERYLVSPEFVADPYPTLQRMQREAPIYWSDSVGGWLVTRYDDIMPTFRNTREYSNEGRLGRAAGHLSAADREQLHVFEQHYKTKGLLHSDPPDHTRLRRFTGKAFSPSRIEGIRPNIAEVTGSLLDKHADQGGMDVVHDLASALPVAVLSELMGIPASDQFLLQRWTDQLLGFQGINKPDLELLLAAQAAIVEIRQYLVELLQARRESPGTDLLSAFVMSETEPHGLSEPEIINTCQTLLVAGHETTTSLIGNGLALLLGDRRRWQRLVDDRSLVRPAIEETLRFESPVARQPRRVTEAVQMGDVDLREGDMVFQMLNAANRDPSHFDSPDEFRVDRSPNQHVGFGFGAHFCIGAPLARAEAEVAFAALLERFPALQMDDPVLAWDSSKANSRVLKTLMVTF
jgi:pimeloyl-[acyl-carrier protein] synthase